MISEQTPTSSTQTTPAPKKAKKAKKKASPPQVRSAASARPPLRSSTPADQTSATPTTASISSTSDREDDLRRALAELRGPAQGSGASERGPDGSLGADSSDPADGSGAAPLLTPEELVEVTESLVGLGVSIFALVTGREIPDEKKLSMSDGTRKLLSVTAPGTLDAAGDQLQEHAELLRSVSPIAFLLVTGAHAWRKVREVKAQDPPTAATPAGYSQAPTIADAPAPKDEGTPRVFDAGPPRTPFS